MRRPSCPTSCWRRTVTELRSSIHLEGRPLWRPSLLSRSGLELLVLAGADAADHVAPALLRPGERHAPDIDAGEDREGEDADERRSGNRQRIVAAHLPVTAEREAAQVDLDAFRDVDVDRTQRTE